MRIELKEQIIDVLRFYAEPKNHEVRKDNCPIDGKPAWKPSRMFMDRGEMARDALSKLGVYVEYVGDRLGKAL